MAEHIELGKKGEELALEMIKKLGYDILERNWRYQHLELDIIAKDGSTLVIVEVKTRSNDKTELPQEAVGKRKQKLLIEAASAYISLKNLDVETRFDIVSVFFFGKKSVIQHIPEAFTPNW
jgi:putative endonuclease